MKVFAVAAAIVSLVAPSMALAAPVALPPPAVSEAPAKKPVPATPARLTLSKRMFAAYGGPELFSAVFDNVVDGLVRGVKPSDQVMLIAAPYRDRLTKSMHAHMPRIVDLGAEAIARMLDENDLNLMIAYLETPASQKMLQRLPALSHDLGLELGWFVRQLALTEPKAAQYLADVKGSEEPPPSWPTAPQANMDALRATIAETPGAEILLNPDKLLEKSTAAGSKMAGKAPSAGAGKEKSVIERKVVKLLPVFISDLLNILANYVTPEDLAAQKAFSTSEGGKVIMKKLDTMKGKEDDGRFKDLGDQFKAIFKEIGHDVMTPSQTT